MPLYLRAQLNFDKENHCTNTRRILNKDKPSYYIPNNLEMFCSAPVHVSLRSNGSALFCSHLSTNF